MGAICSSSCGLIFVLCFVFILLRYVKWKFKAVRNAHLPDIDSVTADRASYTH